MSWLSSGRSISCWEPLIANLQRELWTSWASLLRSYAAMHGFNAAQHAVVEVSADAITLRVGSRWLKFTSSEMQSSDAAPEPFVLHENGTVSIAKAPAEEMDFAAERLTRAMLHGD